MRRASSRTRSSRHRWRGWARGWRRSWPSLERPDVSGTLSTMRGVVRQSVVWFAVLGYVASLGGCRPQGSGGPDITADDVQIELGWRGLAKSECWTLLRVRLRNRGD